MKKLTYLFLCLNIFLFASCQDKDDPTPEIPGAGISEISLDGSVAKNTAHEVEVTIVKPDPCYEVKEVKVSTSGTIVNYNIILERNSGICTAVVVESVLKLAFNPDTGGTYTLNFLINGKLYQSRQVEVSN